MADLRYDAGSTFGAQFEELARQHPAMSRYFGVRHTPRFVEVFKGVWSSSPVYRKLQIAIYENLVKVRVPATYDFDRTLILSVQATLSNPSGTPPTDATARARAKVAADTNIAFSAKAARDAYVKTGRYDDIGLGIAKELFQLCLRTAIMKPVPIKRHSSTAAPHFTTDMVEKKRIADDWAKNVSIYADWFRGGDFSKLANAGILYMYTSGYRSQVEGAKVNGDITLPKKVRSVFTYRDEWVDTDRTYRAPSSVKVNSVLDKRVLRTRARQISQSAYAATIPPRYAARAAEAGLYYVAPLVFHHHGAEDIREKTKGARAYGVYDVANHDHNIGQDLVDQLVARFEALFGPTMGAMIKLLHSCPSMARADYDNESGVRIRGNPFKPWDSKAEYGNPSGSPTTSILAKLAGMFYFCDAAVRYALAKKISVPSISALISGSCYEIGCLNLGDNLIVVARDPQWIEFALNMIPYCPFAIIERAGEFSGLTVVGDGLGEPQFVPNAASFIHKTFAPDRTLSSPHRGNPSMAYDARMTLYSTNPTFHDVFTACNEACVSVTGLTIKELSDRSPPDEIYASIDMSSLTRVELEVLGSPDLADWKYDPSEWARIAGHLYYNVPAAEAARVLEIVK